MALGLTGFGAAPLGPRRRMAWIALVIAVVAMHGWVTQRVVERMADFDADAAMPQRIVVAYVREMATAEPPPTAAPAPPPASPARVARVRPAKPAASAPPAQPEVAEPALAAEPDGAGESLVMAPPPPAAPLLIADGAPVAVASPAPAASGAQPFEWPASTRMSYLLTGNYRGEVSGSAQVEWIRVGAHYQVHLDLVVGPSMAPLITRRMSSDGEITAEGLAPRRYDQDTQVVLRERKRVSIAFEPDSVVLANGERHASPPGVQDTASQFIQLTYVFSTRPELLRVGTTIDIPLALPNKVDVWTYDVVDEAVLYTPFGELTGIHLKPRRTDQKIGSLSAEMWFAPQLRYLPVRIRIEQDAETYIDLMIAKRPEMAG